MANLPPPLPLYSAGAWQEKELRLQLESTPPQTGTTLPFVWPPPHHLQSPPGFEEPVLPYPPVESLLTREIELDALRCEEPSKHQGTQVYDSLQPPPHDDYTRVQGATPVEKMPRWYAPHGPDDDTLLFESRFESGNLRSAEKIGSSEYNLQLAFDINTDRHTQWFYFRISNLRKRRRYKLNMQNLMKSESVYNLGMQPLMYSEVRAEQEGVGWHRAGTDACYFKNQVTRAKTKPFWTLTFNVETENDDDTVYLAHCFPYRYTDLQQYLNDMEESALGGRNAIRRRTLCQTLAGNECEMLTITSPTGDHASKKGIVISARVHPGETNASWMMKGVLDYLGSDNLQAAALRDKFVFKIVPMLNPDGVIVGNYRCSLAGGDLNRQYEDPKRELFPEVLNLKQMIANFGMGKEVALFVDLHGHSKKSNIFMYGVENPTDEALYMRERVIPTLLDRESPLFNLADCSFDVGKGKEGCGRVVARKHLGIVNAYTMEASFMGADQGVRQGVHFNQGHFESMGHSLCEILLDLVDPQQTKVDQILRTLRAQYPIDHSRVVAPRDDDRDKDTGDTSDESDSDASAPVCLAAKPPAKRSTTNRFGIARGGGASSTATKRSPRSPDNHSSSGSDQDLDKKKAGSTNNKKSNKGVSKISKEQSKAALKVPPPAQAKKSLSSPELASAKPPPPVRPSTPSGEAKSSASSNTPKSGRATKGTLPRKNPEGVKDHQSTSASRGIVTDEPPPEARADPGAGNARPGASEAGTGGKRTRVASVSTRPSTGGKGASKSKTTPKSAPKNVPKNVPKVSKLTASAPRRPASSPASRSVDSPRRQTAVAAAAAERSPSAPPKTGVGFSSRKRGVASGGASTPSISRSAPNSKSSSSAGSGAGKTVSKSGGSAVTHSKSGGKKGAEGGSSGAGSSSKSSQGKGKENQKKKASDRPLPPLRTRSSGK